MDQSLPLNKLSSSIVLLFLFFFSSQRNLIEGLLCSHSDITNLYASRWILRGVKNESMLLF